MSRCTELTWLDCVNTQIKSLDVSKNTALTTLVCIGYDISSLDVSKNTALTMLGVGSAFTTATLNELFSTLHGNTIAGKSIFIENRERHDCDRSIAESKGWTVTY